MSSNLEFRYVFVYPSILQSERTDLIRRFLLFGVIGEGSSKVGFQGLATQSDIKGQLGRIILDFIKPIQVSLGPSVYFGGLRSAA